VQANEVGVYAGEGKVPPLDDVQKEPCPIAPVPEDGRQVLVRIEEFGVVDEGRFVT
jgi:hypothetical protein